MDMNTLAQRFATTYGGAMPIAPEMPSFGAIPPQTPSQAVVPQMERPAPTPTPAPSAPSVPDGYDPDEWEQEKKDYAAAIKGGYINKRGVSKDGKMWRGPKSLEFYATHGQDAIFKNANDLSEWNRITFEENRRLAGLPDIPQEQAQPTKTSKAEKAFPKPEGMTQEEYEYHVDNISSSSKDNPQGWKTSMTALAPQNTEEGRKMLAKDTAMQEKARADYEDADNVLKQIDRIRTNLNDKGLPETGFWANHLLKNIEGTDAYLLDQQINNLKNQLAIGVMAEMKNQSATGATGLGATSDREFATLQEKYAALNQGLSKKDLLESLKTIEDIMSKRRDRTKSRIKPKKTDSIQPAPNNSPQDTPTPTNGGKRPIEYFNRRPS